MPTEEEWEYACRAGTDTPLWFGDESVDFSKYANLADKTFGAIQGVYGGKSPRVPPWRPAIQSVDDKHHVAADVGSFAPNPWGLCDMHGNAAEWTLSPLPGDPGQRIIRGGSWYDRPWYARSSYRAAYPKWQRVYDVGFRIVLQESE